MTHLEESASHIASLRAVKVSDELTAERVVVRTESMQVHHRRLGAEDLPVNLPVQPRHVGARHAPTPVAAGERARQPAGKLHASAR